MRYREFTMRKITILLALTVALAFTACDNQTVQVGDKNNSNNTPVLNNGNNDNNDETEVPHEEDEGHGLGEEDPSETMEPGFLSGTWRVATAEDDAPVAHFDIVHVTGEAEITGSFLTGVGIHEDLADETGELIDVDYGDNKFELVFNPTPDEEEFYTITTTERIDDNHFKGKLTAERNDELNLDVTIARQVLED